MSTTKRGLHVHNYTPFPADARFESCACGATRRADRLSENPCVQWWGRGPKGRICGVCAHLEVQSKHYDKWFECRQRPDRGYRHRQQVDWEACARFKQKEA